MRHFLRPGGFFQHDGPARVAGRDHVPDARARGPRGPGHPVGAVGGVVAFADVVGHAGRRALRLHGRLRSRRLARRARGGAEGDPRIHRWLKRTRSGCGACRAAAERLAVAYGVLPLARARARSCDDAVPRTPAAAVAAADVCRARRRLRLRRRHGHDASRDREARRSLCAVHEGARRRGADGRGRAHHRARSRADEDAALQAARRRPEHRELRAADPRMRAKSHGLDPDLVKAVVAVESGFDPRRRLRQGRGRPDAGPAGHRRALRRAVRSAQVRRREARRSEAQPRDRHALPVGPGRDVSRSPRPRARRVQRRRERGEPPRQRDPAVRRDAGVREAGRPVPRVLSSAGDRIDHDVGSRAHSRHDPGAPQPPRRRQHPPAGPGVVERRGRSRDRLDR